MTIHEEANVLQTTYLYIAFGTEGTNKCYWASNMNAMRAGEDEKRAGMAFYESPQGTF